MIRAAEGSDVAILAYLLSRGLDINSCTRQGANALHYAISYRNRAAVQYLCQAGIEVNESVTETIGCDSCYSGFPCFTMGEPDIINILLYWYPQCSLPISCHSAIALIDRHRHYQRTRRFDRFYDILVVADPSKARAIKTLIMIYGLRPDSCLQILPYEMITAIIDKL